MTDEIDEESDGEFSDEIFPINREGAEIIRGKFRKYDNVARRLETLEAHLKGEFFTDLIEAVEPKIASALADIIDDQSKTEGHLDSLSENVTDISESLKECLRDFEAVRTESQKASSNAQELRNIYNKLEKKYAQLEGDVKNLKYRNIGLSRSMGIAYIRALSQIASLRMELTPLRVDINDIKNSIVELRRYIDKKSYVEECIEDALVNSGDFNFSGPIDDAVDNLAEYAGLLPKEHRTYIIEYIAESLVVGGDYMSFKDAERVLIDKRKFTKDHTITLRPHSS